MQGDLEFILKSRISKGECCRYIIQDMLDKKLINNPKQAWRTLEKWVRKGLYNYGVALDLGWLITAPDKTFYRK